VTNHLKPSRTMSTSQATSEPSHPSLRSSPILTISAHPYNPILVKSPLPGVQPWSSRPIPTTPKPDLSFQVAPTQTIPDYPGRAISTPLLPTNHIASTLFVSTQTTLQAESCQITSNRIRRAKSRPTTSDLPSHVTPLRARHVKPTPAESSQAAPDKPGHPKSTRHTRSFRPPTTQIISRPVYPDIPPPFYPYPIESDKSDHFYPLRVDKPRQTSPIRTRLSVSTPTDPSLHSYSNLSRPSPITRTTQTVPHQG